MDKGISLEEACASNSIGTEEDFTRSCNPDGTVKNSPKTTTFNIKGSETKSITVQDTYIHIALAGVGVVILFVLITAIRKSLNR